MTRPTRYPQELRERAVRMVREHRGEHPSEIGRLNRGAHVLVDQFAERAGLNLMRSDRLADTLPHGAFLRWPPARAAG